MIGYFYPLMVLFILMLHPDPKKAIAETQNFSLGKFGGSKFLPQQEETLKKQKMSFW